MTENRCDTDPALDALDALVAELRSCTTQLERARERAERLAEQRREGRPWRELVVHEQRPLAVELISSVLAVLADAGSRWRREEALALHADGLSINRIAALFGVTRQRISALLRDGGAVG
ncbi:MAG TPA: helix-turn-helix domain-containing protein [Pseudonocardia sp.]|nr:helix-turn-helix domain-containing protein [Pseudonocardia sp.]